MPETADSAVGVHGIVVKPESVESGRDPARSDHRFPSESGNHIHLATRPGRRFREKVLFLFLPAVPVRVRCAEVRRCRKPHHQIFPVIMAWAILIIYLKLSMGNS
jgi:hypothetical protein